MTIPAQTVTNPIFGFRIVNSGHAMAVQYVQNETGAFPTMPMATGGGTASRAADGLSAVNFNNSNSTVYYTAESTGSSSNKTVNPFSGISSETNEWISKIVIS